MSQNVIVFIKSVRFAHLAGFLRPFMLYA